MRRAITAAVLAVLVVSAGCVAGPWNGGGSTVDGSDGGSDGADTADSEDSATGGDGSTSAPGSTGDVDGPAGTVNFYVSDRPNDMDDFEHLNVTVTSVRFHLVEAASEDGSTSATETPANGTETSANGTEITATSTSTAATETSTAVTTTAATESATATPAETDDRADGAGNEGKESAGDDGEDGEGEADGRWVTREVNATTVDLTRLRGANATLLDRFELPAGEYNQVVLGVSETNGTLTSGETTEVHLPSDRLRLHTTFDVGNGSAVDFVYDVTVHRAGNSGRYVLRPVVGESGTDQEIERVDTDEEDDESALSVRFAGKVTAGENATIEVTRQGAPVANATVTVDGEAVGITDENGSFTAAVPADAEAVEVEVAHSGAEGELERELGDAGGDDDEADGRESGENQGNGNSGSDDNSQGEGSG